MAKRRVLLTLAIVFLAFSVIGNADAGRGKVSLPEPLLGEDGLHKQSWFSDSFLNLKEDVEEAKSENKRFVIIWEQRGCPYCKRTHEVNFRIPKIVDYIKDNFVMVQLNLWGSREVTDFDGEVLTEKRLAEKWGVRFTPTIQFFPDDVKKIGSRPGNKAELVRVPGYFKPFHFFMLFQYINIRSNEKEPNFQRYLIAEGTKIRDEKGIDTQKLLWSDELLID